MLYEEAVFSCEIYTAQKKEEIQVKQHVLLQMEYILDQRVDEDRRLAFSRVYPFVSTPFTAILNLVPAALPLLSP